MYFFIQRRKRASFSSGFNSGSLEVFTPQISTRLWVMSLSLLLTYMIFCLRYVMRVSIRPHSRVCAAKGGNILRIGIIHNALLEACRRKKSRLKHRECVTHNERHDRKIIQIEMKRKFADYFEYKDVVSLTAGSFWSNA